MEVDDYIVADDRRLAALALAGDDTAFTYLFNRYRDAIRRLFAQRLGGTTDADDLLQETFIKVYINLGRYNPDYTFGQWVYTIARNTFVDFRRRRQEDLPIDERFAAPASPAPRRASSTSSSARRSNDTSNGSRPATGGWSCCAFSTACPTRRSPHASTCLSAR